jgi:type VI secretion system secreted protein Hcp
MIETTALLAENGRAFLDAFWRALIHSTQGGSMPQTETKQSIAAMFKRPLLAGALATAAAASLAMPVPALADTFLKLDGIEGESTDEKHKNEIAVLSFTQSWINTTTVSGAGKGKVQCGAITLMKNIDKSSPVLVKKTIQGVHISSGQLTFRSEGALPTEYYVIKLNGSSSPRSRNGLGRPGPDHREVVLNAQVRVRIQAAGRDRRNGRLGEGRL